LSRKHAFFGAAGIFPARQSTDARKIPRQITLEKEAGALSSLV
jgi:hypothetical protein